MIPNEITIIGSLDEFVRKVEELYQHIENSKNRRRQEYIALGRAIPKRISFEDIDLSRFMSEMLAVQKTLQWRSHNPKLSRRIVSKARLVAIAGVCEFIKNDYLGRFWESYRQLIGRGPDYTVYNWIWEDGFREEEIELIISSSGRREFVQSLILESGIPRRRIGDIIEFFVIYYRHLRHYDDIEDLITRFAEGSLILPTLSKADRSQLSEICNNASDYSHTFARVVQKLNVVFNFIEKSGEVVSNNIRDYTDLIYERTGIQPLEILRDAEQLERLYSRLLGFVTPARLRRILAALAPGTYVRIPSGRTLNAGNYRSLQYGEHLIGSSRFICLPSPGITPEKLDSLPYNELLEIAGGLLLKSKERLKVTIGGFERYDVVHRFFTTFAGTPIFSGAVFFGELPPATDLFIRNEDGRLLAKKSPETGFLFSASLGYFGNYEQDRHGLKIDIHHFKLHYSSLANQKLLLATENPDDKPLIFSVDGSGSASLEQRYIRIRNPQSSQVIVNVVHFETHQEVEVKGEPVRHSFGIEPVMLFAPLQQWQVSPIKKGRSIKFGHKYLVLFLANGISLDIVQFDNLKIRGSSDCGHYRALSLEWVERRALCSIEVNYNGKEWYWLFDQYLEYALTIFKTGGSNYKGISFNSNEGKKAEDFTLVLTPVPRPELRGALFWNIAVNGGMPVITRFESSPAGQVTTKGLEFGPGLFSQLIKPAVGESLSGVLNVEVSLSTTGNILATDRIWLFPDLEVETKELLREGETVEAVISYGSKCVPITLTDNTGSKQACIDLKREDGHWEMHRREYSSEIAIDEAGILLDLKVTPRVAACKLCSNTGGTETLRNMFMRELKDHDILVLPGSPESPTATVNGTVAEVDHENGQDIFILRLGSIANLTKTKNQISIQATHYRWAFDVLHKLIVVFIKIHERFIVDTIFGEVSFCGPVNSGVLFVVYEEEAKESNKRGSEKLISAGDDFPRKVSFTIQLQSPPVQGSKYIIKLYLLTNVNDTRSAQEYGESWLVYQQQKPRLTDFQTVITAIQAEMKNGSYFQAKNLLTTVEGIVPAAEKAKVQAMATRVEFLLCRRKIESVIRQASRVLKKEYALEEFKE